MAVVRMWPVKSGIADSIGYAMNRKKTDDNGISYITGINCCPELAAVQMMRTKDIWQKREENILYCGVQSFREGETDAATAHEAGTRLCEKMWGDDHEIVVTTHLNTDRVHNHFCVNPVGMHDGKRFPLSLPMIWKARNISDALCREYGLSVIDREETRRVSGGEYWAKRAGQPVIRDTILADAERALAASCEFSEFVNNLEWMGYRVVLEDDEGHIRKYPAVYPFGSDHVYYFNAFGDEWATMAIAIRAAQNLYRQPLVLNPELSEPFKEKKDLAALYARYLQERERVKEGSREILRIPFILRQDSVSDKAVLAEKLLREENIHTGEDLENRVDSLQEELTSLIKERTSLQNRMYNAKKRNLPVDLEEMARKAGELGERIKEKRLQLKVLDDVRERSGSILEAVQDIDIQRRDMNPEEERDELYAGRGRADHPSLS